MSFRCQSAAGSAPRGDPRGHSNLALRFRAIEGALPLSTVEDRHAGDPYCYLTTTGRTSGRPHEIEIWFAAVGQTIYMMNGGARRPPGSSDWVRNARANLSVRVRIGDELFEGEAREVAFDSPEHERARDLLVAKYATAGDDLATWRATAFPVAIALHPRNRRG